LRSTPTPMRIRFIKTADTYPLRRLVLWPGSTEEDCDFPNDRLEGSFHLAAQIGAHRVAIGSFYPEKHPALNGWKQFHLRGMATHPDFRGLGAGRSLLRFGLEHLQAQQVDVLWCHARPSAVPFYERMGFARRGDVTDLPGFAPRQLMVRRVVPPPAGR